MLASLTVRILSGALVRDAWAEVEFTTSDMPPSNTSAICKSVLECDTQRKKLYMT